MYKKLTKKEKIINLLSKGKNVTWKHLRTRFDLKSPTKMVDTIQSEAVHITVILENQYWKVKLVRMGVE